MTDTVLWVMDALTVLCAVVIGSMILFLFGYLVCSMVRDFIKGY